MDQIISKLILYGGYPKDEILMQMADICKKVKSGDYDKEKVVEQAYRQVKNLLILGTDYGFDTNLWHNYLTFLLITNENPFSLTSEKTGAGNGSVNHFAKNDYKAFLELFHYDFSYLEEALGVDCFSTLSDYTAIGKPELMYNKNVSKKVQALSLKLAAAKDEDEFFDGVTGFYKDYGVGMFGLNKAFRIGCVDEKGTVTFQAINNMEHVVLDDLIGYELQKQKLIDNTEAFVNGKKANNVLLFGDSGTGKSTSIKAIVNEYYDKGLRMIEIYKHQFQNLSNVIAQIKNRNYKFIIYMDDLSFEDFEIEYKFLKAVIEGGVETKPENVLIYATSNRRHLIKETWNDRNDMEYDNGLHRSDTMEEKLSLVYRFGVTICYSKPSPKQFQEISLGLARRAGITLDDETILAEANKWELSHGGISGRTAEQFVKYLSAGEN
ncbi:MAG: ATP-binding protein [Lachnospiraceae bacterium]|nr:ATP-binding protein [Lachnospiraceae bacterium]